MSVDGDETVTDELTSLLEFRPTNLAWAISEKARNKILGGVVPMDEALLWLRNRKSEIERSELDPLRAGYEPHIWKQVAWHIKDLRAKFKDGVIKIIIWGGNRSSKTRFAANYVNRDVASSPKKRWWCCDSTEAMSRSNQMRLIYEQLPPEWRHLPRNRITDLSYSISDGFSKNRIVCPNASEIDFKFYSMDIANLPGPELDGIWCDELVPLTWVETLVYRLINRNGLMIVTFTPELGWNETFGYFYEGAQTLESVKAPLLPKYDEDGKLIGQREVPRVMQCSDPTARIIFFHNTDNPFGNYPALVQQLKGKSEEEISIRAYGLCSKSHSAAFPMMNRAAHVITQAQFAAVLKQFPKGERYQLVDPCSGRNWFLLWVFCPSPDKWYIYREWPSHGHNAAYIQGIGMPGPWALSGAAADGVAGPSQKTWGFGLNRYREEIEAKENGEIIIARYIDSRYASAATLDRERTTTLIEQLAEVGIDFLGMTPESRILGVKDGSIDMINSALYYDVETELGKFSPSLGKLNEPQLQIVDTCPNTIYALEHWTGKDGQKGACKDPVDCVRGLFLTSVNYVGTDQYSWKGGGIPR